MEISKGRIGQFFFFIGIILLIIFFTINPSQNPIPSAFFSGFLFTNFGLFLLWRGRKRPEPGDRFRMIRRIQSRPKKEKVKKE